MKDKILVFDTETKGLYGKFLIGGVLIDNTFMFFDDKEKMKEFLKEKEKQGYKLTGHNVMYDFTVLDYKPESLKNFHDTLLYAKAIGGLLEVQDFNLEDLCIKLDVYQYQTQKNVIRKMFERGVLNFDYKKYVQEDLEATHKLFQKLFSYYPVGQKVYAVDKMMVLILLDIQKRGISFARKEAEKQYDQIEVVIHETAKYFRERFGININSPVQIVKKFKLPNAQRSTLIEAVLNCDDAEKKKAIEVILQYKNQVKQLNFLDRFLNFSKYDGRVRGYFHPCGAISGRLSCVNENLLQIPRNLRSLFVTDKYFLIYDFSQIELRLAGQIWKEPLFIKTFQNDEDLHLLTSKTLFKKGEISKEERQTGKIFNFAMLYGAGIKTLSQVLLEAGLNYSVETVRDFRYSWFNLYKQIAKHHKEVAEYLRENKTITIETALGRVIQASNFSDALNFPIQGSGADLLKGVVIKFLRKFPDAKIINLVHDEIQIECETEEEAKIYAEALETCLKEAWETLFPEVYVPVKGEYAISKSLAKS